MNEKEIIRDAFLVEIEKRCLTRNFGVLSKSEFDGLVFHYYLQLKNVRLREMNSKGYVSDYEIGRDLGLTIQRVRSLREKESLRNTDESAWREMFFCCVEKAAYDEKSGSVKILIPDVNVIKEVRHFLEIMGLYDEYQLNPKLFQCKLDVFISLCLAVQNKDGKSDEVSAKQGKDVLGLLRNLPDEKISKAASSHRDKTLAEIKEGVLKVGSALVSQVPIVGGALDELAKSIYRIIKIRVDR